MVFKVNNRRKNFPHHASDPARTHVFTSNWTNFNAPRSLQLCDRAGDLSAIYSLDCNLRKVEWEWGSCQLRYVCLIHWWILCLSQWMKLSWERKKKLVKMSRKLQIARVIRYDLLNELGCNFVSLFHSFSHKLIEIFLVSSERSKSVASQQQQLFNWRSLCVTQTDIDSQFRSISRNL